jgi:hypothetical protein
MLIISSGESEIVMFAWNTTGLAVGKYTISANVTLAPGETNNWTGPFTSGIVYVMPLRYGGGGGGGDPLHLGAPVMM